MIGEICLDDSLTKPNILIRSVFCFLVTAESSPELRINTTRNVLRQLNKTYKKAVTLHSASIHEQTFLRKSVLVIYPLVRFHTGITFRETRPWLLRNNLNILPHQQLLILQTRNHHRNMIRKYSMFEKKQKTEELCASLSIDKSIVTKSFERADEIRCSIYRHYGYYVYGCLHRSNNTYALLYTLRKHRYVIAELKSRIKWCEFPNCTHYYAEPKNRWTPLCSVHGRVWNEAFKSIIRPSTFQLLQSVT